MLDGKQKISLYIIFSLQSSHVRRKVTKMVRGTLDNPINAQPKSKKASGPSSHQ